MERITIVGIGPVGVSMALALKRAGLKNTEVVATSGDRQVLSVINKMNAVDKTESNLGTALRGAQMVILDVPLTETRELMEGIGPVLEDGAVVTDTSTSKGQVMKWADQYFPKTVSYVGGRALIKKPLHSLEDANAEVFSDINYCVMPAQSANQQAIKTVVGLVETLGARPLFLDHNEHDSYSAAVNHLPMILSCALMTVTSGSESWREMHRLADSEFAEFTSKSAVNPEDNEAACLANPEGVVHWIDEMIGELYTYRNLIKDGTDELLLKFINAWEGRARWDANVVIPESGPSIPSARDSMATAFLGEKALNRFKKMTASDDKKSWNYTRKN